jgi:hypothetical protein
MTRGKRGSSKVPEATSVEDAIAKLQALKRERAQSGWEQNGETGSDTLKKPGRSAKASPAAVEAQPVSRPPTRPGRKPKEVPAAGAATAGKESFGVGKLTAHRPLGLLEVQESADLDALMADPRLAGQIAMRLDERFALVLPASLERLQAALLKAGHTPKLVGPKSGDSSKVGNRGGA